MPSGKATLEFFLGGRDLEMATIQSLLESRDQRVHDRRLAWGARASAYRDAIQDSRAAGNLPVLVELEDDLGLSPAIAGGEIISVDHHGERAGKDVPTALEQVFRLLELPPQDWSRQFDLVAANDRGHIRGMLTLDPPATAEELRRIRAADRQAQGITPAEEAAGRAAVDQRRRAAQGRLTIVELPHAKSATVTDSLAPELGGPGYENLLILSPAQTQFFGSGKIVRLLQSLYPGGWWGGELPEHGFWGIPQRLQEAVIVPQMESV